MVLRWQAFKLTNCRPTKLRLDHITLALKVSCLMVGFLALVFFLA